MFCHTCFVILVLGIASDTENVQSYLHVFYCAHLITIDAEIIFFNHTKCGTCTILAFEVVSRNMVIFLGM